MARMESCFTHSFETSPTCHFSNCPHLSEQEEHLVTHAAQPCRMCVSLPPPLCFCPGPGLALRIKAQGCFLVPGLASGWHLNSVHVVTWCLLETWECPWLFLEVRYELQLTTSRAGHRSPFPPGSF